jgi:CheY-like chemotaxis protein
MAKTVLVVEDNPVTREGLTAILLRNGFSVTAVEDGLPALDLLDAGPRPDVILLDMMLPVLDGWHFLKRLRASPHASVPVVIVTGAVLTREWAEAQGCAGFLLKPIDEGELLTELRQALKVRSQ